MILYRRRYNSREMKEGQLRLNSTKKPWLEKKLSYNNHLAAAATISPCLRLVLTVNLLVTLCKANKSTFIKHRRDELRRMQ